MTKLRLAVGMVVFGSLVLAGCGGDGDKKEASTTPTTVERSTDENTGGGGSSGAALTKDSCVQAASAMAQAASGFSSMFGGASADLKDSVDAFEAFADAAPSEIRADLEKVAEGYAEFIAVLADVNFDPNAGQLPSEEAMARLEAASEKFEDGDFAAAAERVSAWFDNECGTEAG